MKLSVAQAHEILNVSVGANEDGIRKAYKRLALKWHPDKNKSPEATHKFQEVSAAYKRLTEGEEEMEMDIDMSQDFMDFFSTMFDMHGSSGPGFGFDMPWDSMDDLNSSASMEAEMMEQFIAMQMENEMFQSFHHMGLDQDDIDAGIYDSDEDERLQEQFFASMGIPFSSASSNNKMHLNSNRNKSKSGRTGSKKDRNLSTQKSKASTNEFSEEDNNLRNKIELGSLILVRQKYTGVVKYIGPAHYAKGEFVGVELSQPEGKNNGTIKGQVYFSCKAQHGLMVRRKECTLV